MDPLTLTDAKQGAIVARWLDQWVVKGARARTFVNVLPFNLHVYMTGGGLPATYFDGYAGLVHASREDLVQYVTAWARGTK